MGQAQTLQLGPMANNIGDKSKSYLDPTIMDYHFQIGTATAKCGDATLGAKYGLAAEEAARACQLDTGDTAWLLTSCALVLMMTIPGLALYYSGLVRSKNVITMAMQTLTITCLITFLWFAFGYSLSLAPANPYRSSSNPIYGDGSRLWLRGLNLLSTHANAPTIPESVYCLYQLTFAIITAALISGSFADRMKYWPMVVFMTLWHLAVYCPIAHAMWHPDGFLYQAGVLDFAGGNVVHIASGWSGLAAVAVVGNRRGFGQPEEKNKFAPSNLLTTLTGFCLLWVGWLGFNGGSAVSAGAQAGAAALNTQIATAVGGLTWMLTEVIMDPEHKPKLVGMISGAVAGLVSVTPGAGFIDQNGAFWAGFFGGLLCFFGARIKHYIGYDDALDAFGVHAVGGMVGGVLVGFFGNSQVGGAGPLGSKDGVYFSNMTHGGRQLGVQLYGIGVSIGWSVFMSTLLLLAVDYTMGLRVSMEDEDMGLDASIHGEENTPNPTKDTQLEMVTA